MDEKTKQELIRTKQYFPFRHVYAIKDGDAWEIYAKSTKRHMLAEVRKGKTVITAN